jgi:pyridoxine/pyridoxamine 5'-phosphate oxidase
VSLEELQRVIDGSLTSASPLAKRVYDNEAWSAERLQRFVNRVMAATVATVRADGRPHTAVVLTACLDGTVHFAATDGSTLLRNLERRPDVAMTVVDQYHDVTVHGTAHRLGRASELPDLVRSLHQLSRRGQFTPRGWEGSLWAVDPARIFLSS